MLCPFSSFLTTLPHMHTRTVHTFTLTHTLIHTHDGAEDGDRDVGLQGVIEVRELRW